MITGKKSNVTAREQLSNTVKIKDFSSFGYRLFFRLRKSVSKRFNVYGDIGFGKYDITIREKYENNISQNGTEYLSSSASIGLGIRITKYLFIISDVSGYILLNPEQGATFFNFKIGPTLFFQADTN